MRAPIDLTKPFPRPVLQPAATLQQKIEFSKKDGDGNNVLTSDEYGVGKDLQDEFRRYDSNHDGKMTLDELARGRRWDTIRDQIQIGHRDPIKFPPKQLEPVKGGAEKKEEPSFLQKAFPWLALANPITAPIGLFSLAKKLFD